MPINVLTLQMQDLQGVNQNMCLAQRVEPEVNFQMGINIAPVHWLETVFVDKSEHRGNPLR
ncbi:hypothetical protein [Pseudomonas orientalis]|uniref:hypothetical protein n=1 Tax=Pseudomonas orientalis TaxID=76758 RepID=UPI0013000127|nr:hypothetical protein [Pseudomonas orientalis]